MNKPTLLLTLAIISAYRYSNHLYAGPSYPHGYALMPGHIVVNSPERRNQEWISETLAINNFMNEGLSYTQAKNAVTDRKMTMKQAVEAAQKDELLTVEKKTQRKLILPISLSTYISMENDDARRTREIANYLHGGLLNWNIAATAQHHGLSIEQAQQIQTELIKRNNVNHDLSGMSEIITQIKADQTK